MEEPTVSNIVKRLLPLGSNEKPGDWNTYPFWPPDVFAVAATLVENSGCYTLLTDRAESKRTASRTESELAATISGISDSRIRDELGNIAAEWRSGGFELANPGDAMSPREEALQTLWSTIVDSPAALSPVEDTTEWAVAALKLLAVADLACVGIGFHGSAPDTENWITTMQRLVTEQHIKRGSETAEASEFELPATLCLRVPAGEACVQPKTRTPTVGCTIRSMSHHLALLPPHSKVKVQWHHYTVQSPDDLRDRVFNVLVVPFPYHVTGNAFAPSSQARRQDNWWRYFSVEQNWLPQAGSETERAEAFWAFLDSLIDAAEHEVSGIDGVVFPELALDRNIYEYVSVRLRQRHRRNLGFFISGVLWDNDDGALINAARTTVYLPLPEESDDGERGARTRHEAVLGAKFNQSKHHRWKLDRSQIRAYSLSDTLDTSRQVWWEDIDIRGRHLGFFVFRPGACFTTLICEDLARVDPCQSVIRAIGPNLIFALLMDGPQLETRWPGRYAMGLADDPGSSILSVSSLGLMTRSNHFYRSDFSTVALWRDCAGSSREIDLPTGHHGLVLTLRQHEEEEFTLDGRSDGGHAYHWLLDGCLPVKIDTGAFPWIDGRASAS